MYEETLAAVACRLGMNLERVETEHVVHPAATGIEITVRLVKHPDDKSRMGAEQYAVAAQVINAIPYAVAAKPGLLTRPVATPARDDYLTFVPAG